MFLIAGAREQLGGAVVRDAQVLRLKLLSQLFEYCERGEPSGLRVARVLSDLDGPLQRQARDPVASHARENDPVRRQSFG